jgi:hypothetical protein
MERLEALTADEAHNAPDWDAQREELACPLCDYNLRGLREPRCPECGYRFAWADLADPTRRVHPYLFEHHPERNWWSFYKTAVGGLRPVRFWRSLAPTQPQRLARILLYWLAILFIALLCVTGIYLVGYWPLEDRSGALVAAFQPPSHYPLWLSPSDVLSLTGRNYVFWWVWGALWPWLTFLSLMVFRISMRRARVKSVHVLRCVLYSEDSLVWGGLSLLLIATACRLNGTLANPGPTVTILCAMVIFGCAAMTVGRLCVAFDRYLRFDHAWATVLASQAIVTLLGIYLLLEFEIV